MELTWPMRLRIAAAAAAGVILIGFLGWPFAASAEPYGIVSLKNINISGIIAIASLSFLAGFLGYFLSWPHGREIGILAVPSGLAIWSVKSGSVANLLQVHYSAEQRLVFFSIFKWEAFFWLAIIAVGFAGVQLGSKLTNKKSQENIKEQRSKKESVYLNAAMALVGSILIAGILIMILAQDVRAFDEKLGDLVSQPSVSQIIFAVLVSFGAAGFAVKKFLNLSYIIPIASTAFLTMLSLTIYAKGNIVEHLSQNWPPIFLANSTVSILPIQMVCFGTIGSIWGYWLAVKYRYWRKHEI